MARHVASYIARDRRRINDVYISGVVDTSCKHFDACAILCILWLVETDLKQRDFTTWSSEVTLLQACFRRLQRARNCFQI